MGVSDYQLLQREYLLKIAQAMTRRLDLPTVLGMVIEYAVRILNGRAGFIVLRREHDRFEVAACQGIDLRRLPQFQPLLADLPIVPDPQAQGQAHWPARRLRKWLDDIAEAAGIGLSQAIALPLEMETRLIGAIFVFRSQQDALFSAIDEQVLRSFADQAAIAIENARLYGEAVRLVEQLSQQTERLHRVIEQSPDGILVTSGDGQVVDLNPALERLTGWTRAEAIGRRFTELLNLINAQGRPVRLPALEDSTHDRLTVDGYLVRRDKQRGAFVHINISPLNGAEGQPFGAIINVVDITRLKESEDAKSTFLASISHELKTPLSLIIGYAETLAREDVEWDRETLRESAAVIRDEAQRLTRLVNNLLEAARTQSGRLLLQTTDTRIDQIAHKLVAEFQKVDTAHLWTVDFPPDFPSVEADPERIRQVLQNLLSNAVKYSPAGGLIRVAGWVEENQIGVLVSDEGPGIPFEMQQQLFQRFARGQGLSTRQADGAGLGLYLAKTIVEAHGGRIWLESMPERGTTFYFTLPRGTSR